MEYLLSVWITMQRVVLVIVLLLTFWELETGIWIILCLQGIFSSQKFLHDIYRYFIFNSLLLFFVKKLLNNLGMSKRKCCDVILFVKT